MQNERRRAVNIIVQHYVTQCFVSPHNILQRANSSVVDQKTFNNNTVGGNSTGQCSMEYSGSHCLSVLQSYAACESPETASVGGVYVSSAVVDQMSGEDSIGQVLFALETFIKPSDECRSAVIPFLCLYTFGVCGVNNDDYRPTVAQCMEIRDSICESEWKKAADILALTGGAPLPDCSSLREQGLECDIENILQSKIFCVCHASLLAMCDNVCRSS